MFTNHRRDNLLVLMDQHEQWRQQRVQEEKAKNAAKSQKKSGKLPLAGMDTLKQTHLKLFDQKPGFAVPLKDPQEKALMAYCNHNKITRK